MEKEKPKLEQVMDNPDVWVEERYRDELIPLVPGHSERVKSIDEDGIVIRSSYKTGDGIDCPYDSTESGVLAAWNYVEKAVETEGVMKWVNLVYCHECEAISELEDLEEYDSEIMGIPEIESELSCPECGSKPLSVPEAPKWIHMETLIEFDEEIKTVEDLERELSKIFGKKVSI